LSEALIAGKSPIVMSSERFLDFARNDKQPEII
jgi:hypothetical protein